jgi:hypothetical protein
MRAVVHQGVAVLAILSRRLAPVEATGAQITTWHDYFQCPRTLGLLPADGGQHPAPLTRG